jgi:hypothetical protein
MKAIGGYFSLEINDGGEYHHGALQLNAGRYALEYILRVREYSKVFIPYYICSSILEPFKHLGVDYEFYHINEQLEPSVELHPKDGEAILYVNYFGLKNRYASTLCYAHRNTILDYTQAFYSECGERCGDKAIQCDTFYSCRKYFGVPDGAYLYLGGDISSITTLDDLPQDESFERMIFLTKRIDRSPQEGYTDFRINDKGLSIVGMRRMSHLTKAMMCGIDYTAKAQRRILNYHVLDKVLRGNNRFKWNLDNGTVPLVYPYYVEDGSRLRQHLIDHQIFCACYWPNVLEWCQKDDLEYDLAQNVVCIPIDQRYDEEDMKSILSCLNSYL